MQNRQCQQPLPTRKKTNIEFVEFQKIYRDSGCKYPNGYYENVKLIYFENLICETKEQLVSGETYYKIKYLLIDDVIYCRPYVTISTSDGAKEIKTFETIEECNEYHNKIMSLIPNNLIISSK